jgi:hypothetical protein
MIQKALLTQKLSKGPVTFTTQTRHAASGREGDGLRPPLPNHTEIKKKDFVYTLSNVLHNLSFIFFLFLWLHRAFYLNEVKYQLMHNYLLKVHTLKHSHPRHVSVPGTILRGVRRVPS